MYHTRDIRFGTYTSTVFLRSEGGAHQNFLGGGAGTTKTFNGGGVGVPPKLFGGVDKKFFKIFRQVHMYRFPIDDVILIDDLIHAHAFEGPPTLLRVCTPPSHFPQPFCQPFSQAIFPAIFPAILPAIFPSHFVSHFFQPFSPAISHCTYTVQYSTHFSVLTLTARVLN